MPRCPQCNTFAAYEESDPEVDSVEIDQCERPEPDESGMPDAERPAPEPETVAVRASVRIVNVHDNCGTELKEATLELEGTVEIPGGHSGSDHELEAEEAGSERTSRQDGAPGTPSRYRRTYYGAKVDIDISCSCGVDLGPPDADGKLTTLSVTLGDDVAASGMDDLT